MGIKLDCNNDGDCTVCAVCTALSTSTGRPGTAGIACGSTGGGRFGAGGCTDSCCCSRGGTGASDGILGGYLKLGSEWMELGLGMNSFSSSPL